MAIDPITLLVLGGGALMLASQKKKKRPTNGNGNGNGAPTNGAPTEPPACPVGFVWDEGLRSCVPSGEGPPQIHVTGLCEAWQMLPFPQVWFDSYAAPAIAEVIQAIGATPNGLAPPEGAFLMGQNESMGADALTHILLANSPIAFATPEFPQLGLLCKLPLSEQLGPDPEPGQPVPPAMVALYEYVTPIVTQAIIDFNESGQVQFPEIPA